MTSLLPWVALLLPLASAIVILVATRPLRTASAFISVAAVLGSFVCACLIFFQQTAAAPSVSWIDLAPAFSVPLGLTLDPLSRSMLFMVTGVGCGHPHLLVRLHGHGRGQVALFRRTFALHVRHARNRPREQFRDDVYLLGTGRGQFLFADWPLVRASGRRRGRKEGLHHQPHRGLRFHAWHPDGLDRDRFVSLRRHRDRDGEVRLASRIFDGRRAACLLRCRRQVGAISPPRLVARRDGRSDAGFRLDPCGDDGRSGRLYVGPRGFPDRCVVRRVAVLLPGSAPSPLSSRR